MISPELSALVSAVTYGPEMNSDRMYQANRKALLAKLSELERDAQRYRWLRDCYRCSSLYADNQHMWTPKMAAILRGPSVDAAIDAAREVGKP